MMMCMLFCFLKVLIIVGLMYFDYMKMCSVLLLLWFCGVGVVVLLFLVVLFCGLIWW